MFGKVKEINPYPVSDKVRFRNLDKTITLTVRGSASSMILALKMAQERLSALTDESTDTERQEAAHGFSTAIFGKDQTDRLMEFYGNDYLAVITACGTYFSERLSHILTKAQKK